MNCGMDGWMYAWRVLVREIGRDEGGNKGTGELWLCNESLIHLVKGRLSLIHPSCERKAGKLSSPIPNVPWLLHGLGSSSANLTFFLAPRQLFMGGWSTQELLLFSMK